MRTDRLRSHNKYTGIAGEIIDPRSALHKVRRRTVLLYYQLIIHTRGENVKIFFTENLDYAKSFRK